MQAARAAQEELYLDLCTVTEYQEITDPDTHLTNWKEVVILKDYPCKLSFETMKETEPDGAAVGISQITKLFISPEVVIRPGSKISVTRGEKVMDYTNSGPPTFDKLHQEIMLTLFKGWA